MRKLLSALLVVTMPMTTFAGSVDLHSVIVQNNETADSFALNTETTRTAYRTEVVYDTCYRQEIVGYQRVCDNRPFGHVDVGTILASVEERRETRKPELPSRPERPSRPAPPSKPERPTRPAPPSKPERPTRPPESRPPQPRPPRPPEPRPPHPRPPVCYDRPIYRSVAYQCSRTISIPYEVTENHSATASVRLGAAPANKPQTGSCGINFKLSGDNFSATNMCVDYIATANITKTQNGDAPHYNYDITLHNGEAVYAPLAGGLKGLKLENGTFIVAKVGNLENASNFTLKLYVQRKKFLASDVTLINRALKPGEYTYQAIDDKTGWVRINADKVFGGIESRKKHEIALTLSVGLPEGTILEGGFNGGRDSAVYNQIIVND